jgi:hypothetical protein
MVGLAWADAELGLSLFTLDLSDRFGVMRRSRQIP